MDWYDDPKIAYAEENAFFEPVINECRRDPIIANAIDNLENRLRQARQAGYPEEKRQWDTIAQEMAVKDKLIRHVVTLTLIERLKPRIEKNMPLEDIVAYFHFIHEEHDYITLRTNYASWDWSDIRDSAMTDLLKEGVTFGRIVKALYADHPLNLRFLQHWHWELNNQDPPEIQGTVCQQCSRVKQCAMQVNASGGLVFRRSNPVDCPYSVERIARGEATSIEEEA